MDTKTMSTSVKAPTPEKEFVNIRQKFHSGANDRRQEKAKHSKYPYLLLNTDFLLTSVPSPNCAADYLRQTRFSASYRATVCLRSGRRWQPHGQSLWSSMM